MSDSPPPLRGPTRVLSEETARKWRKRRSRVRRWLRRTGDAALVVLAVVAIFFAVERSHGSKKSPTTTADASSLDAIHPPAQDVKLTGCTYFKKLFSGGVTMNIINHTGSPWTYYIDVRWNDGGKKFSETVLHSKRVAAFRAIRMGGFGLAPSHSPPNHLTCSIISVHRVST